MFIICTINDSLIATSLTGNDISFRFTTVWTDLIASGFYTKDVADFNIYYAQGRATSYVTAKPNEPILRVPCPPSTEQYGIVTIRDKNHDYYTATARIDVNGDIYQNVVSNSELEAFAFSFMYKR